MKFVCRALLWVFCLTTLTYGNGLAYEIITVDGGGVISGKVRFKGTPPSPRKMLLTKDKQACGAGYREVEEVSVSNGALRNVVVVIEDIKAGKAWPQEPPEGYVIDQKGCRFIPHLQVVPKGAKVTIINSDPVLHNIHAREIIGRVKRTVFNIAQPLEGQKTTRKLRMRRGDSIKLECDAHDFMHAWMYTPDNPYYALVGGDGSFSVEDVPPGKYGVKAWHPTLGTKKTEINVSAKEKVEVSFEFELLQ
jgi:hypothetical protein